MQVFSENSAAQWIELGGGTRRKIRAYNGEVMLVEVGFDDGAIGKMHTHPHSQISYVLSGEFTYTIGEKTVAMYPGDSIVVDGGLEHGCACVKAGILLDVFAPMREDFVKQSISAGDAGMDSRDKNII